MWLAAGSLAFLIGVAAAAIDGDDDLSIAAWGRGGQWEYFDCSREGRRVSVRYARTRRGCQRVELSNAFYQAATVAPQH